ncbi:hypothetical protein NL676_017938 [Syzygium grande]|nr:hypothetical protein NL676_017938 [Syzygium grande]
MVQCAQRAIGAATTPMCRGIYLMRPHEKGNRIVAVQLEGGPSAGGRHMGRLRASYLAFGKTETWTARIGLAGHAEAGSRG